MKNYFVERGPSMMRPLKLIPFALIFSISITAFGYEVATHEEMSDHAARRSVLSQNLLSDIGLTGTLTTVSLIDNSIDGSSRTVLDWIRYGANHEDDTISAVFARYRNHFYNPLDGRGYHYLFLRGLPSPLWGLEDQSACPPQNPQCNPVIAGQIYSLRNARDYFYNGLTSSGTANRDQNLAKTFQTLGHVMHLIEDAAQPQHTRNDSHAMGSLYELFTDEFISTLPYDGYPSDTTLVKLNTAVSFWHTLPPQIDISAGQGIAEYSNRSFVTTGTNFRYSGGNIITDPNFPSPAYDPLTGFSADLATMTTVTWCTVTTNLKGQLTFYGNTIFDSYTNITPPDFNPYATTLSIFDADLQKERKKRLFILNRFNFCAAQQFLIPRAVGYSGGLIDYFFRGKLEANYTGAQGQLTVTVKNISGPENTIQNGTFELYYDATDGTRKSLAIINGANVGSAGIVDGDSWVITANSPGDVDRSKQNPYMLVYRGIVGTEEAVIGKAAEKQGMIYLWLRNQAGEESIEGINALDGRTIWKQVTQPNDGNFALIANQTSVYANYEDEIHVGIGGEFFHNVYLEKRSLLDGNIIWKTKIVGDALEAGLPVLGADGVYIQWTTIDLDDNYYMYLEKHSILNGDLIWRQDITLDRYWDLNPRDFGVGTDGLYITGVIYTDPEFKSFLEKRSLVDGALIWQKDLYDFNWEGATASGRDGIYISANTAVDGIKYTYFEKRSIVNGDLIWGNNLFGGLNEWSEQVQESANGVYTTQYVYDGSGNTFLGRYSIANGELLWSTITIYVGYESVGKDGIYYIANPGNSQTIGKLSMLGDKLWEIHRDDIQDVFAIGIPCVDGFSWQPIP